MIALANSQVLDTILCKVFNHKETVIVGFAFGGDLAMLAKYLKNLRFYKKIGKLLDI
jgi:predicted alpha/beta-fold hydrolase